MRVGVYITLVMQTGLRSLDPSCRCPFFYLFGIGCFNEENKSHVGFDFFFLLFSFFSSYYCSFLSFC